MGIIVERANRETRSAIPSLPPPIVRGLHVG